MCLLKAYIYSTYIYTIYVYIIIYIFSIGLAKKSVWIFL